MTLATEVEALEIEARLATVQRELEAEAAAAVARKAEAAKLAAAGDWEAARAAYSALLEAAWQEDAEPDPALLANRAACALRLGQLDACVADCDAALGDDDADGGGDGDGDGDGDGGEARLPSRLRWKLLLRPAEALRGLGRADEVARAASTRRRRCRTMPTPQPCSRASARACMRARSDKGQLPCFTSGAAERERSIEGGGGRRRDGVSNRKVAARLRGLLAPFSS